MTFLILIWVLWAYFWAHFLVITSILKIFWIAFNNYYLFLTIFSIFLPVICMIIHRYAENPIGKLVYISWMTYVWAVVILSYVFALYRLISLKYNSQILWYIAEFLYGYKYGMYQFKNMKFYVSSGTALWWPPLRLFTKNEIVVIDIKK